jgi:hypothetical protein
MNNNDFRLMDPFLTPEWRNIRVCEVLALGPNAKCTTFDDKWVVEFTKFARRLNANRLGLQGLRAAYPELFYAYKLYESHTTNPDLAMIIEARLLSGASAAEIAHGMKTREKVIEWYTKLFFDVSDFLDHKDWVMRQVLLPSARRVLEGPKNLEDVEESVYGDKLDLQDNGYPGGLFEGHARVSNRKKSLPIVTPFLDWTLKLFSYFGGPMVCDTMISGFKGRSPVTDTSQLVTYFQDQFVSQLTRRATQAATQFEINKYNVMELFQITNSLVLASKRVAESEDHMSAVEQGLAATLEQMDYNLGGVRNGNYIGMPRITSAAEPDVQEMFAQAQGVMPESLAAARSKRFQELQSEGD